MALYSVLATSLYLFSGNFSSLLIPIIPCFSQIISNSLKYSKENIAPEISITSKKITEKEMHDYKIANKKDYYKIVISDNGIGIAKEDLENIFNPFFRSKSTEHPEIKGTGLGLSIVKRITDLLDIKFKIDSKIDVGTSVILVFNEEVKTL